MSNLRSVGIAQTVHKLREYFGDSSGFSLPSVLFILLVLTTLSLAFLSLSFFERQLTLRDIATVKATYGAESAITLTVANQEPVPIKRILPDSTRVRSEVIRWGGFIAIIGHATSGGVDKNRTALAARVPGELYRSALIFGSDDHQLVLAGLTFVRGDIITGLRGVTVGSLPDRSTPRKIPVVGSVRKLSGRRLPRLRPDVTSVLRSGLETDMSKSITIDTDRIDLASLGVEVTQVHSTRSVTLTGSVARQMRPLRILCDGDVSFSPGCNLRGLVAVESQGSITVPAGVELQYPMLIARKRIELLAGSETNAQFYAPEVRVRTGATTTYPSVIGIFPFSDDYVTRGTVFESSSEFRGFVVAPFSNALEGNGASVVVHPNARVVGAVFAATRATLDGTVIGTVLAEDFYFHDEPTDYFGWLRSAQIDATARPDGFLVPDFFVESGNLEILDFL